MKMKKLLVAMLSLAMVVTGLIGNDVHIQAELNNSLYITENPDLIVVPGETTHISIPVKTMKDAIVSPILSVSAGDKSPFKFSKPTLSVNKVACSYIPVDTVTNIEFDVTTDETAAIKDYPIDISYTFTEWGYESTQEVTKHLNTTLKIQDEMTPAQLTVSDVKLLDPNVGSDTNLSFTVKNEGEVTAKSIYLLMDFGGAIDEGYTAKNIKVGNLATGETKLISLPVSILSTAGKGKKTLVCNFTYKTLDGAERTSTYKIYVNLSGNISSPELIVKDATFESGLTPGDDFNLSVVLKNTGSSKAKNISATIDDSSVTTDGILKNFYADGIDVDSISAYKSGTVSIPLTVSKYATGGMKTVKLIVTYTDANDVIYTSNETIYIDVTANTTAGTPNIVISNVVQSPEQPIAGDQVTISFDLENKSNVNISELKVYADGLTGTTFIPIESEPYQYIESLKSGKKVRISMPLEVSKSIAEGLNNLTVKYSFTGGEGSVIIPVRDVQNDLGSGSKPKLIVSNYTTDVEELRAGSTFNFTYDIYNTNASVAAKNITVTITQADNIFTVTQGSNSFFISNIAPGETVQNTVELKVKSDATTKAYPLKITIEYEYEGIEANPTTGEIGETKTEELNLQAMENARPVADNIQVYSWDGNVTVGNTATLSFEFYNMGKSVLNNVIATVECDGFTKADGSMYFIGNVEAGSSTLVEFDVIPNMEGAVPGSIKLSYEDSNGDTVEFTKEFEGMVMPAAAFDPGAMDGDSGEVFNPEMPTAKEAILPIWAFVLMLIAIFVLFVPITRKIIISVYKAKLRKKNHEQY